MTNRRTVNHSQNIANYWSVNHQRVQAIFFTCETTIKFRKVADEVHVLNIYNKTVKMPCNFNQNHLKKFETKNLTDVFV